MAYRDSEAARKTICWLSIENGDTLFYCYGDECSAWESEPEEERRERAAKDSDITPRGYCSLLMAKFNIFDIDDG